MPPVIPTTKVNDLPPRARDVVLNWVDHLVMDTPAGAAIANSKPEIPVENRKKALVALIDRGILKPPVSEDMSHYRWLIWDDDANDYIPFR